MNLTQDGWFHDTIALSQHFELVRIRAVEARRALLRAANTGLSALVGLDGQMVLPVAGPVWRMAITRGLRPEQRQRFKDKLFVILDKNSELPPLSKNLYEFEKE